MPSAHACCGTLIWAGALAQAYLEGVRQYQEGSTDRNVAILAKYTKLEPELLKKVCWPAIPADGSVNLDSIRDFQAWAVERGDMQSVVDPEAFWDGRFLQEAEQGSKEPQN